MGRAEGKGSESTAARYAGAGGAPSPISSASHSTRSSFGA